MFEIHGMAPGEVVPTLDLMLRHVDPADRDRVLDQIAQGARDGTPFGCQYRLLDLSGSARTVTLTGSGEQDDDAERVVSGFLVDTTAAQQRAMASRVNSELALALESHAVIDQAKGALMLGYGIDGDAAFELLRWGSQQRNIKLVTLARRLVAAVQAAGGLGSGMRRRLDDTFFASLSDDGAQDGAEHHADRAAPVLRVGYETVGGVPTAVVEGPVDLATVGDLSAALTQLMARARRPGSVVVDLRAVSHLGSVGVSVLTAAHRRAAADGVRLRIVLSKDIGLGLAGAHGLDVEVVATPGTTGEAPARWSEPAHPGGR
jgi:anti-anti-sigma factor